MNDILSKDSSHLSILHDLDSYSYGDLSKFSHRVTACIRRYVPSPAEKLAALHIRRCFYFFGCVLGTLRGGMAFCPLNVEDAKARTSRKLKTADPTLIFTDHEMNLSVELNMQTTMLFVADIDGSVTASSSVKVAETCFEPAALCYVIFTSGTTGEPKGVMVESGSVNNMICATISAYELTEHDRVFQFYNLAFDGSIWEYLPTFSVGCTLVLWTPPLENAFSALMKYKVTVFSCTSSVLAICEPETFPHLRCVGQGGEPLTADLVRKWACPKRPLIDSYGPTECCVFITQQRFTEPVETVLLGPAVHNCSTHVLDEDLKEVAVGEEGQLYAGGVHLARGYLHDFKKTEQKFISHPVLGRLYATGDLVRKECGGLKYISRCDSQVKINGFRVELGEITSCLNSCYGVKASAAAVKEGSRLLAYIVWEATVHEDETKLLTALAVQRLYKALPTYMQPQQVLSLPRIPHTNNGKLDSSRLPDISESVLMHEDVLEVISQLKERLNDCKPSALARDCCAKDRVNHHQELPAVRECVREIFLEVFGEFNSCSKVESFGNSIQIAQTAARLAEQGYDFLSSEVIRKSSAQDLSDMITVNSKTASANAQHSERDLSRQLYEESCLFHCPDTFSNMFLSVVAGKVEEGSRILDIVDLTTSQEIEYIRVKVGTPLVASQVHTALRKTCAVFPFVHSKIKVTKHSNAMFSFWTLPLPLDTLSVDIFQSENVFHMCSALVSKLLYFMWISVAKLRFTFTRNICKAMYLFYLLYVLNSLSVRLDATQNVIVFRFGHWHSDGWTQMNFLKCFLKHYHDNKHVCLDASYNNYCTKSILPTYTHFYPLSLWFWIPRLPYISKHIGVRSFNLSKLHGIFCEGKNPENLILLEATVMHMLATEFGLIFEFVIYRRACLEYQGNSLFAKLVLVRPTDSIQDICTQVQRQIAVPTHTLMNIAVQQEADSVNIKDLQSYTKIWEGDTAPDVCATLNTTIPLHYDFVEYLHPHPQFQKRVAQLLDGWPRDKPVVLELVEGAGSEVILQQRIPIV